MDERKDCQLIGQQDAAGCGKVGADALSFQCWDIDLSVQLAAGKYTVSIQQYNNYNVSANLADGFYYQGPQYRDFRNGFVDEMDVRRSGAWALDILDASPAPGVAVPEPGSPWLIGAALLGMLAVRGHRQRYNRLIVTGRACPCTMP